jgi:hypothetical protein
VNHRAPPPHDAFGVPVILIDTTSSSLSDELSVPCKGFGTKLHHQLRLSTVLREIKGSNPEEPSRRKRNETPAL